MRHGIMCVYGFAIVMFSGSANGQVWAPEKPDNPRVDAGVQRVRQAGRGDAPAAATMPVRITQVNVNALQQDILGDAANEPSLAHDPTAPSRIAVGWRQFDTTASNFREAGVAWSNDHGRTWHASELESGLFRSDPVLRARSDGTIIYNSLTGDFFDWAFFSSDGGRSWSQAVSVPGGDKTWVAIDRTGGPGDGFVYNSWNIAGNNYAPATFARSVDGGISFENPIDIPSDPVFGTNFVGPDGELYIFGVPNSGATSTFFLLRSTNANNLLSTPTFVSKTVPMGGTARIGGTPNPGGLIGQSQVVVDSSTGSRRGWVYLLATVDPPSSDPGDITFVRSENGGQTFTSPAKINPESGSSLSWQWFGTMGIAPNGRLDVVYNSTDGTGSNTISKLMYITSSDGGTTWSAAQQLTGTFNSIVGQPNQNKIGDYYDIESDDLGASVIISATFTGGQDVYYIRIGPEDCDRNGRADSIDIAFGFDPDCNGNDVPDSCDIASGFSGDLNQDGRPDGCAASCPGDFNLDGAVDDSDFVMFSFSYNVLVCADPEMPPLCRADLNSDHFVDDEDFSAFASAYDALLCP